MPPEQTQFQDGNHLVRLTHHSEGLLICGGDACVRNTRITVHGLAHYRQLGFSDQRLLGVIQGPTQDDLAAAREYCAAHPTEIDDAIRLNEEA